jgi:hypothetical protein
MDTNLKHLSCLDKQIILILEYLLEDNRRHGKIITSGILCETDLNYLHLILQEKLVRDVFYLFVA